MEEFVIRNAAGEPVGYVTFSETVARLVRDDIIRRAWEMERIQAEIERLLQDGGQC